MKKLNKELGKLFEDTDEEYSSSRRFPRRYKVCLTNSEGLDFEIISLVLSNIFKFNDNECLSFFNYSKTEKAILGSWTKDISETKSVLANSMVEYICNSQDKKLPKNHQTFQFLPI